MHQQNASMHPMYLQQGRTNKEFNLHNKFKYQKLTTTENIYIYIKNKIYVLIKKRDMRRMRDPPHEVQT